MDNTIIVAIIISIPPFLMAFLVWKQGQETSNHLQETKKAVQEIHVIINSRLDALLKAEKSVSKQEGRDEINN